VRWSWLTVEAIVAFVALRFSIIATYFARYSCLSSPLLFKMASSPPCVFTNATIDAILLRLAALQAPFKMSRACFSSSSEGV